ncbi:GatB/YqeY domain-containing protein [Maritalea sp.]|uniref:GatB/YqeY domain-containing protein n=1 Tax=Maritalea sp. TaxID=2003361 RepID=UPI003EF49144
MRDKLSQALKVALKARDTRRTSTYRLINAAIKDRDIEARGKGKEPVSEQEILQIMQKMVKQREESATVYAENDRPELAQQEREEIVVIQEFLPQPLNDDELQAAIAAAIAETGAEGLRDMGKVVGILKAKYPGRIDFGHASKSVKAALNG